MILSKSIKKIVAVASLFFGINAMAFSEGVDYVKLEKPIPDAQNTVIKVFSYDCPFCYKYDKSVTIPMLKKLPNDVTFITAHLSTKAKYGVQGSELLATMIIMDTDAKNDILSDKSYFKKAKFALYKAYHDKKNRWNEGEDAFTKTALDGAGVSLDVYNKAKQDSRVQDMLDKWSVYTYDVAKIQGIPAFVVNGKYLVYTSKIKSIDAFASLVEELLKK